MCLTRVCSIGLGKSHFISSIKSAHLLSILIIAHHGHQLYAYNGKFSEIPGHFILGIMLVNTVSRSLRQFDAFAKPLKEFRIQTVPGAFLTLVSIVLILFLFFGELYDYISPSISQEIIVDVSRNRKMAIDFDIIFPKSPCFALTVDSMDVSGEQHVAIKKEIEKIRLNLDGTIITESEDDFTPNSNILIKKPDNYCGSCYGANLDPKACCNTCQSVIDAYRARMWVIGDLSNITQCHEERTKGNLSSIGTEGCQLKGHLGVNKVAGSFHISPGRSYGEGSMHIHDLQSLAGIQFDLSHQIRRLSFGEIYPGQINPLDNTNMTISNNSPMISYFLKLVPTLYSDSANKILNTNQYSVTWQVRETPLTGAATGVPGAFFNYEISPLLVKLSGGEKSFLHFLTNTCAIIGGVFTVTGLLDAFIYKSSCLLHKTS